MIKPIDGTEQTSETHLALVHSRPDPLPASAEVTTEEVKALDALQEAKQVLQDLADSIMEQELAGSPDADRLHGRITPDTLDLLSS